MGPPSALHLFEPKMSKIKMTTPYGFEVDHNDNIWYASMYTDVMEMLDPKTGKVTEYASPYGEKGSRDMDEDSQGRIWFGAQPNAKVGHFYVRSEGEKALAQKR
jgi:streptogramin lyase